VCTGTLVTYEQTLSPDALKQGTQCEGAREEAVARVYGYTGTLSVGKHSRNEWPGQGGGGGECVRVN